MKDGELRRLVLAKFYEVRNQQPGMVVVFTLPGIASVEPDEKRLVNICEQLKEQGLIRWKSMNSLATVGGMGKITSSGVDIIESAPSRVGAGVIQKSIMDRSKKVFIGHGQSLVWHQLKEFLSDRLRLTCNEFNAESVAGISTIERLQALLADSGFAFLVMTAEDGHADGTTHARENVIHEAGLFQGKLGFRGAIILLEHGCAQFSNIQGLTYIGFPKGNLRPAFEEIRRVLEREAIVPGDPLNEGPRPVADGSKNADAAAEAGWRESRKQEILDSLRQSSRNNAGNCLRADIGSDKKRLCDEMVREGSLIQTINGYMLPEFYRAPGS